MEKRYTHMTFFWGKNSEVLFRGWPGTRGGMYALALVVVFLLGFLVELLSCRRLTGHGAGARPRRRGPMWGVFLTTVHTLRVGIAYLLMLALMSFNVGILLVAIAGSAAGFLLFHSSAFCPEQSSACGARAGETSPLKC